MAKDIVDIVEEKHTTFANMMKDIKTKEELEKNLLLYSKQKEELRLAKETDKELAELKVQKGNLSRPYTETIKTLDNMIKNIHRFSNKFDNGLKTEVEANLISYLKQIERIKYAKDNDAKLNAVNDAIKEVNEDFKVIKDLELKCAYIDYLIREKFSDGEEETKSA